MRFDTAFNLERTNFLSEILGEEKTADFRHVMSEKRPVKMTRTADVREHTFCGESFFHVYISEYSVYSSQCLILSLPLILLLSVLTPLSVLTLLAEVPALRCGFICSFHVQWCWFRKYIGYAIWNITETFLASCWFMLDA